MPAATARGSLSGSLSGVVRSVTGAGLAGICVTAVGEAPVAAGQRTATSAVSAAGGRYTIGGLLPGAYAVRYQACGDAARYASQWYGGALVARAASRVLVSPALISAERPTLLKPVTLRSASGSGLVAASRAVAGAEQPDAAKRPAISGVVTNAKGKRLSGICVNASSQKIGSAGSVGTGTLTHKGVYHLPGLSPGHWTVEFQAGCGSKGNFAPQWWRFASKGSKAKVLVLAKGSHATGIDAKLGVGAALSGVVKGVSSSGAGISGICVEVNGVGPMRDVFEQTKTGADGKYVVTGLGTGRYQVDFEPGCGDKGDFIGKPFPKDVAVTDGKTTRGINGVLPPAAKITGTITAAAGHAPLSGICVETDSNGGEFDSFGFAESKGNGHYVVDGLAAGKYTVDFSAACGSKGSFAPITYDNQVSPIAGTTLSLATGQTLAGIDASMPRGGVVTGKVTDTAGHALNGICVLAQPVTDTTVQGEILSFGAGGFSSESGGISRDGRYRISDLLPGSYRVSFSSGCGRNPAEAVAPQWFSPQGTGRAATLAVGPGPISGVDAKLAREGVIAGIVTTPAGKPARGICASAVGLSGQASSLFGFDLEGTIPGLTDKHGAYHLSGLAPGRYDVEFEPCLGNAGDALSWYKQAGSQARARAVTVRSGAVVVGVDQKMMAGTSISGKIIKTGGGAPGTSICVLATDSMGNLVGFGVSSPGGGYSLGHLAPATYSLEFLPCSKGTGLASTAGPHVRLGAVPAKGVNVAVPEAGSVGGRVMAENEPAAVAVGGICATATPVSGDGVSQTAFSDAGGVYKLTDLAPGKYRVTFSSQCVFGPGGLIKRTAPQLVTITAGVGVSTGATTLLKDGGISGTVKAGGKPVPGVCVLAFPKASTGAAPVVAVTAASGSYRIGGLAPASYVVEFTAGCGAAKFRTQWFDGASTRSGATPVTVSIAKVTGGIDA